MLEAAPANKMLRATLDKNVLGAALDINMLRAALDKKLCLEQCQQKNTVCFFLKEQFLVK